MKKINKEMEDAKFVPNSNISAELTQSWHIPRPTLARSSHSSQGSSSGSTNSTQSARSGSLLLTAANLAHLHQVHQSSTRNNSKQDGPQKRSLSTSALTTTRNENIKYYLQTTANANNKNSNFDLLLKNAHQNQKPSVEDDCKSTQGDNVDNASVASSMHFTVVNVNSRPPVRTRSCCKKHQLSVLVITMSVLFSIGIIAAIFLLEVRARRQLPY